MNTDRMRFLGLLGLVGLLGVPTGNYGLFGFFGFFGLFGLMRKKSDEMLRLSMAQAGLNACIASLISLSIAMAVVTTLQTAEAAAVALGITFFVQVLTLVFSFNYYESKGVSQ